MIERSQKLNISANLIEKGVGRLFIDRPIGWGLVEINLARKRYGNALELLQKMEPRWDSGKSRLNDFYTLRGLALDGLERIEEASHDFLEAVLLLEEIRHSEKQESKGFFLIGRRFRAYEELVSTISERVIKGEKEDKKFISYGKELISNALYFSESTKARTLIEEIAASARSYQSPEIPAELSEKEQLLIAQLAKLDETKEDAYKKGEDAFKEHQKIYKGAKAELDQLIAKLRKEYPRYAALMYPQPLKVEELPLKDEELLLEYEITEKASYLFVVEKGVVKRLIKIPKSKEEIEGLITEFLEPFNRAYSRNCESYIPIQDFPSKYEEDFFKKGKRLFNLLLAEALKDISPEKNIIIVPDGILGILPFEALVINVGKDYRDSLYVGDRWEITYGDL